MSQWKAPDYIQKLVPYVPGKPIEETQRELKLKRVVKMASNENPLGPSPKAVASLKKIQRELHRYPDSAAFHLKKGLADLHGEPENHFVVGNGSEEIIDFTLRSYCVPGDVMITSQAAFIAYKISAQIQGMKVVESPLTDDLRFDLKAMLKLVREHERTKVVFIANPNNPTGTYVTEKELTEFLEQVSKIRGGSVWVVLDSAYCHYVKAKDCPDAMKLRKKFRNVIVMQTFSKAYGLSGLRVGYGVADPEIIAILEKARKPFNLNSLAQLAALSAISDRAFLKRVVKVNEEGKKFWYREFKKMNIPYWPTEGNFVLIDVAQGFGKLGGEVFQECLRQGVIFRPVTNYGLPHALRISIGTMSENRFALKALQKIYASQRKISNKSERRA